MRQRYLIILVHIAGWLLFFSLVIGFVFRESSQQDIITNLFSGAFLFFCFIYLFVFYFNAYVLVPYLYFKKKQWLYFASVAAMFILVFWIHPFEHLLMQNDTRGGPAQFSNGRTQPSDERPPPSDDRPPPSGDRRPPPSGHRPNPADITGIILFIAAWSLSTAICVGRQWRLIEQRAVRAEADKANAELSFLKMQINPHFLFNTLNNLYMLAVIKDDKTAPAILKLSNIMRYLTDEVHEDLVPLQSEAECVEDYIGLQRLRLNKNTQVNFTVEGDLTDKSIAPLIMMTFVENTFKHGISNHEPSEIVIRLASEERYISFFCQNKLFETKRNTERTGIGISNAKQRLEHMYPDKHLLIINSEGGLYTVQLTLQI